MCWPFGNSGAQWCEEVVEDVHAHRRGAPAWFELVQHHPGADVEGHADSWRVPACVGHSIRQWCRGARLDEFIETKPFSDPLAFRGPATRYGQRRGATLHQLPERRLLLIQFACQAHGRLHRRIERDVRQCRAERRRCRHRGQGLEDDSNRDGAALPQPIVERGTPSQWPPPVLAGCLRLNRDLTWVRAVQFARRAHILLPGATRASLGLPVPAPERRGGLFASLLALEDASSAVRQSSRRRQSQRPGGAASALSTLPATYSQQPPPGPQGPHAGW